MLTSMRRSLHEKPRLSHFSYSSIGGGGQLPTDEGTLLSRGVGSALGVRKLSMGLSSPLIQASASYGW